MLLHATSDSFTQLSTANESEYSLSVSNDDFEPPLSESQVSAILEARESPRLEFKRVSGKMVSKALETICAFANSNGGTLILGVADAGSASGADRIYGIEENPEAVDELRRKIATHFNPGGILVRYRYAPVVKSSGVPMHLVIVDVDRSEHVHSIVGDGTWTRLGASNCQMTARQIVELAYKRGDRTAETECMEVDCALLGTPTWQTYARARGLLSGDIIDQLLRVDMAELQDQTVRPRRVAVLLFAGVLGYTCGGFADTQHAQVSSCVSRSADD